MALPTDPAAAERARRRDAWKRTARTVIQTGIGLVVAVPWIVAASGLDDTVPAVATALAVSGAVTRLMAIPAVQRMLPEWLRTLPPAGPRGLTR